MEQLPRVRIDKSPFSPNKPSCIEELKDPAKLEAQLSSAMSEVLKTAPRVLSAPQETLSKIISYKPLNFVIVHTPEEGERIVRNSFIEGGMRESINPIIYFIFLEAALKTREESEKDRVFTATPLSDEEICVNLPEVTKALEFFANKKEKSWYRNEIAKIQRDLFLFHLVAHEWAHLIAGRIRGEIPSEMQRELSRQTLEILKEGENNLEVHIETLGEDEKEEFRNKLTAFAALLERDSRRDVPYINCQTNGVRLLLEGAGEKREIFFRTATALEEDFVDYLISTMLKTYTGGKYTRLRKKEVESLAAFPATYEPKKFQGAFERVFGGEKLLIRNILCGTFHSQLWERIPEHLKAEFCRNLLLAGSQVGAKERLYELASQLPPIETPPVPQVKRRKKKSRRQRKKGKRK